ncbi:MAG: extracellular solute-binding protein [Chloroflexi bacterium]|nr:extracellular solute-binding protein [Chloroflexota bacterium]
MKHGIPGVVMLCLVSLAVAFGCSPKPPPAVAPTTPAAALAPTRPQPSSTADVPEDREWQEVIASARQEGKLVLYDSTFFTGDRRIAVPRAFKDKYGISMEILVTGGSSATIEKLQVEQKMGASIADLFAAGSSSGPRMISLGLTEEVGSKLPVLRDKSVFLMDPVYSPGKEAISFGYTLVGAAANGKVVQAGEIQSYKDLLKPKYTGKIIMRDPRLGSGGSLLILAALRHLKQVDDEFLRTLHQRQSVAMWGGGESEVAQMIARGEYLVDMAAAIDVVYASLFREGAPVIPVYMQEGTMGLPGLILVSKGAPHPNAARLFINWLLSAEGQTVYHKAGATTPLRKDVEDFLPADMRKEPIRKLIPVDWEISMVQNKVVADRDFDRIFGKR